MLKKRLNVTIVSYNSQADIKKCVESVFKTCPTNIMPTVVVVDNASTDKAIEVAKKAGAITIANKKNLGFSKAVNIGLKAQKSDYYLLLNPDAQVLPGCIEKLIEAIDTDETVGASGPHMQDSQGNNTSEGYYMKTPSLLSVMLFSTSLRKYFIRKPKVYCTMYQECNLIEDRKVDNK